MAKQKELIKHMDKLGYIFAYVPGFSDDFLMWQSKINENDIFGLDGWDAVDSTINKAYEIMSKYTGKEILKMEDILHPEYDRFAIKIAKNNIKNNSLAIAN